MKDCAFCVLQKRLLKVVVLRRRASVTVLSNLNNLNVDKPIAECIEFEKPAFRA